MATSSPTSAVSRHRLTVSAYERMADAGIISPESRVELINGEIFDMSPIGSLHAAVVSRLARDFIVAAGEAAIVRVQDPLRLDDFNELEPDLALLTPREDFYATCHPGASRHTARDGSRRHEPGSRHDDEGRGLRRGWHQGVLGCRSVEPQCRNLE
jgi:hypothetical protein